MAWYSGEVFCVRACAHVCGVRMCVACVRMCVACVRMCVARVCMCGVRACVCVVRACVRGKRVCVRACACVRVRAHAWFDVQTHTQKHTQKVSLLVCMRTATPAVGPRLQWGPQQPQCPAAQQPQCPAAQPDRRCNNKNEQKQRKERKSVRKNG